MECLGSEQSLLNEVPQDLHGHVGRQSLEAGDGLSCVADSPAHLTYNQVHQAGDLGQRGGWRLLHAGPRGRVRVRLTLICCLSWGGGLEAIRIKHESMVCPCSGAYMTGEKRKREFNGLLRYVLFIQIGKQNVEIKYI